MLDPSALTFIPSTSISEQYRARKHANLLCLPFVGGIKLRKTQRDLVLPRALDTQIDMEDGVSALEQPQRLLWEDRYLGLVGGGRVSLPRDAKEGEKDRR